MLALDLHINARGVENCRKPRGAQVSLVILTNDAVGRVGIWPGVYVAALCPFVANSSFSSGLDAEAAA